VPGDHRGDQDQRQCYAAKLRCCTPDIDIAPWGIAAVKVGGPGQIHAARLRNEDRWAQHHRQFHGQSIASSLGELVGLRLEETIAVVVIVLLVLIPFFAFRVLSEAIGEGRLERMFFIKRESLERR
jgi:hypothetical protein